MGAVSSRTAAYPWPGRYTWRTAVNPGGARLCDDEAAPPTSAVPPLPSASAVSPAPEQGQPSASVPPVTSAPAPLQAPPQAALDAQSSKCKADEELERSTPKRPKAPQRPRPRPTKKVLPKDTPTASLAMASSNAARPSQQLTAEELVAAELFEAEDDPEADQELTMDVDETVASPSANQRPTSTAAEQRIEAPADPVAGAGKTDASASGGEHNTPRMSQRSGTRRGEASASSTSRVRSSAATRSSSTDPEVAHPACPSAAELWFRQNFALLDRPDLGHHYSALLDA
ncbi:hypothetical protein FB107DRAFT_280192, partial [Schizophyllum commune]